MSTPNVITAPRRRLKWDAHPDKIGAWLAESDFGTSPAIREVLRQAVDEDFLTYLPASTAAAVSRACADFYAAHHQWDIDPDTVHVIPDVVEGLRLTIRHFIGAGAPVIVPTPAYMPFLNVPALLSHPIIEVPSVLRDGRWHLDLDRIDQAFAGGAQLLVLCNPHNPLGQVMRPSEMREVSAVVQRHGARVFADEIHAPVVYPGARHIPYASHSPAAAEHTVTSTSTSKGWNVPGLKSAQLILSSTADQQLWRRHDPVPTQGGSILGAVAAVAAYAQSEEWLAQTLTQLQQARSVVTELVRSELPLATYLEPEATYLAWLDLSAYGHAAPAQRIASHGGVALTDGADCGSGFSQSVRFTFATQTDVLHRAISGIATAMRG